MSLFKRLLNAVRAGSVSQDQWDEIRSALITADLGVKLADQVIEQAKSTNPEDAVSYTHLTLPTKRIV